MKAQDLREQWLNRAVEVLRPHFKANAYEVPTNIRVTCGFPSRSAMPSKRQRIGECWADSASDGKVFEIFISPVLHDPMRVLGVLAHECVHAVVGLKIGHKAPFKRCATAIGLEGKMTATSEGEKFVEFAKPALKQLGDYPHKRLNVSSAPKKGGTRLLKCECPGCGYIARVTNKWIDEVGPPVCPVDKVSMEVAS